jgi:hypothetical protein
LEEIICAQLRSDGDFNLTSQKFSLAQEAVSIRIEVLKDLIKLVHFDRSVLIGIKTIEPDVDGFFNGGHGNFLRKSTRVVIIVGLGVKVDGSFVSTSRDQILT